MSIFDAYEKELCDKEREEAELNASNEYQKELDEGLPHIEKLEDGSWVGTKVCSVGSKEEIEQIQQDILDEIDKHVTKNNGYVGSNYILETSAIKDERFIGGELTIKVKLKRTTIADE